MTKKKRKEKKKILPNINRIAFFFGQNQEHTKIMAISTQRQSNMRMAFAKLYVSVCVCVCVLSAACSFTG